MDKVINLGIPHVGEQIFEMIETQELIKYLEVSETWKVLTENVLIKRWKGKIFEAYKNGETKVVQVLLERCNAEESGLNTKDFIGRTTLMVACKNGHKDVVQLLLNNLERNIDFNARCYGAVVGWTALDYADKNGHDDVVRLLVELTMGKIHYASHAF